MRIIAGNLRGKKLYAPTGLETRPTADRLREAIFNIIAPVVRNAEVLDLFAGTGACALEALSRGATSAVMIDKARAALALLKRNIAACRLEQRATALRWDIVQNLHCLSLRDISRPFNLVFADPPYNRNCIRPTLANLSRSSALAPEARVVIEHSPSESIPADLQGYALIDQRRYGKSLVSFLISVV